MAFWKQIGNSFLESIYPERCIICEEEMPIDELCFCVSCYQDLPLTDFHLNRSNEMEKLFWGKINIEKACALFFFQKGEVVQELVHKLKYRKQAYIGLALGHFYGKILQDSEFLEDIDLIIPVPIHNKKKRLRGYNQSLLLAQGISKVNGIPIDEKRIQKIKNTVSQTNMNRTERLKNLKDSFEIKLAQELNGKHILIIDDIITTGSTIEAMALLMEKNNVKISVATFAIGKY